MSRYFIEKVFFVLDLVVMAFEFSKQQMFHQRDSIQGSRDL